MTDLIVAFVMILVGLAMPGPMVVSPQGLYESGIGAHPPPPCREPTPGEKHELGLDEKGKAATYSIDGEYHCEHAIFDYGERSSYDDFVVRQAGGRAEQVGRQAAQLVSRHPSLVAKTWTVEVLGGPSELRPHVKAVFEQALSGALGALHVGHHAERTKGLPPEGVRLTVSPRFVQDADILFDVTAMSVSAGGAETWRL